MAACGLPAAGRIFTTVTYTLTADCTQTGALTTSGGITVTINGGGHTITAGNGITTAHLISIIITTTMNLNQVTVDGNGEEFANLIAVGGHLAADDVTFRGNENGVHVNVDGTATLTDVLFEGNQTDAYSLGGNASALNVSSSGGAVTITDGVFRNNDDGGAAISVNQSGSGSVTTNGCLTFSGNVPYNVYGSWTDNSTGTCTGTIGNGGTATSPPALLACGLPGAGNLDVSASYSLNSDCDLSGGGSILWRISDGVNISIQGNGYRLSAGAGSNTRWIYQAGNGVLTLRNVAVDHVKFYTFGTVNADQAAFRDTPDRVFYHLGAATFRNILVENISTTRTSNNAAFHLALHYYGNGNTSFENAVFRGVTSSGAPVLNTTGTSRITLNGCITFADNTAPDYGGNVVDNSSCGPAAAAPPDDPPSPSQPKRGDCFQALGAIGLICRPTNPPEPTFDIWGITPASEGFYILSVTQSQVFAPQSSGLVVSSADGRVAVRLVGDECVRRDEQSRPRVTTVECIASQMTRPPGGSITPERFTIVSMGPNVEGKVHNVVFTDGIAGDVIGTVDTYTGLPGVAANPATAIKPIVTAEPKGVVYAPAVTPQPAEADGSITHVVQPGDTLFAIAVAYDHGPYHIANRNQLPNEGRLIHPGQRLIIRDPD